MKDSVERQWEWLDWFVPALFALVVNPVVLFLTGAGHAPFIPYIPFLLLWGPLSLVGHLMKYGDIYQWNETAIMAQYIASPSLLYLLYTCIVGLTPGDRRWTVFRAVLAFHLTFTAGVSAYGLYQRLW